jgi:uncharacterized protein YndB with AHSA1/START domain
MFATHMHHLPSDPRQAVVAGDFDMLTTDQLFDAFTKPELITKWWPEEAAIDLRPGGKYVLQWPQRDWNLRGEYLEIEPGRHLAFTWSWDHQPGSTPLRVDLWLDCIHESGTRLAIYHGPFELTEQDQESRLGIVEGWIHFCMRLAGLSEGSSS